MKSILLPLALVVGCVIGILLAFAPLLQVEADKRAAMAQLEIAEAEWRLAEEQRQSLVTQNVRDWAAHVWIAAGPGFVLLLFSAAVLGLLVLADKHMLSRDSEQVAENGTIRILRSQRAQVGPAALAAFWWARFLGATPAPRLSAGHVTPASQGVLPEPSKVPDVIDLGQVMARGFVPSRQSILLGLLPGGKMITAPVGDLLCHIVFAGRTGVGKSNLARLILVQVLVAGAEVFLLDPHYAPTDPKTGDEWHLIAGATYPGRAITSDTEIMQTLLEATEEVRRRLELRREGKPIGRPRFYMIDEAPGLADDREFMKRVAIILRQARKVDIFAILASQDMLTSTLQTTGGVRGQFATCYCGGGDRTTINTLLGQYPGKGGWPEPPGKGVLYLKSDVLPKVEMVRVPLVTNADVARLLTPPAIRPWRAPEAWEVMETIDVAARKPADPEPEIMPSLASNASEREARVRALFASGMQFGDVLKAEWGVSGGRAYADASKQLSAIVTKIAGG
jgi:hypothetical protein